MRPSLKPAVPFNVEKDCEHLRKYVKGLGANEEELVKLLTKRTLDQRVKIEEKYNEQHKGDLKEDLEIKLSGVFEKVILSLMKPSSLFLAEQVEYATKVPGIDESALIEILCTRDDESIKKIEEAFEKKVENYIEEVLKKHTEGYFQKILLNAISSCRKDSDTVSEVVDQLFNEDISPDAICTIVTSRSFEFLKRVFEKFSEKGGDFEALVEKHFSGNAKKAIEAIYKCSKCIPAFFADALNSAMTSLDTDDWALIRIIVSRCEIDMEDVKEKYKELYNKDLIEQIRNETARHYQLAFLNLLGANTEA